MKIFVLLLTVSTLVLGYGEELNQIQIEPPFPDPNFNILCSLNEEICETECYNPTTHKCLTTKDGSLHKVCKLDETLCGTQCMSGSGAQICLPRSDGVSEQACATGELACRWKCYKPEEAGCFDKKWLCPRGQFPCGESQCYSPANPAVQCLRSSYWTFLCKTGDRICGRWGCYDPIEQTCFESEELLCKKGEQLCGRDCYNPTAGDTCNNGTSGGVACKAGQEFCNDSCYDPTEGKVCANGLLVCNSGETNCGLDACYVPTSGAECIQVSTHYHFVCDKGKKYCHHNCYEPGTEVCLTVGRDTSVKVICPIGHQFCDEERDWDDYSYRTRTTGCYDPATSNCLKDNQDSYVICKKGQSLCGTSCYTPTNEGLVCRENRTLCKPEEAACGPQCFDSATGKCFQGVRDTPWG